MKRRLLVLVLGIATLVTAFPRRAAADDFGRNVLIGALIGGVVGGIVGIVRAASAPKPAPMAVAPHAPALWTAGDLALRIPLETPDRADTPRESPWSGGALLTF
jgi:hypothetical protein